MSVSPAVIGVGAGIASGLAVGFGATRITDGIAARHPTGSDADRPASRVIWGAAALGFATAAGGMAALVTGRAQLGAGLLGAGMGAMLGSFGANVAFSARHGVGVETSVQNVLDGYDHDSNGRIDLEDDWWHGSETQRTVRTRHEDSDGDVWYETDVYSIERLATRADADGDWIVTRGELTGTIGSYDADRNGRLQGDELARFDREVGERQVY